MTLSRRSAMAAIAAVLACYPARATPPSAAAATHQPAVAAAPALQGVLRLEVVSAQGRRLHRDRLAVRVEVRNTGEVAAKGGTVTCTVRDPFDRVLYSGRRELGSLGRGQARWVELDTPLVMSRNVFNALDQRVPLDLREGGGVRQIEATLQAQAEARR